MQMLKVWHSLWDEERIINVKIRDWDGVNYYNKRGGFRTVVGL